MQQLLKKLVLSSASFDGEDIARSIELIASGETSAVQIASFLTALKLSGHDAEPRTLAIAAQVMRQFSIPISLDDVDAQGGRAGSGPVCDIVGTGGDGQNTFNVSTTAGIVAAGAGCRVYKVSDSKYSHVSQRC